MGAVLSAPVELIRIQRHGSAAFRCGVAEMQGWRSAHEDAHDIRCGDKAGAFWVLDGHGGDGVSVAGAPKLGEEFADILGKGDMPADDRIEEGFIKVDKNLRKYVEENPKMDSGTTVVGAMICKEDNGTYKLKICNAGDSRGIIVRGVMEDKASAKEVLTTTPQHLKDCDEALPTAEWPLVHESVDHKPSHPTEKTRIEAAGGFVTTDDPPRLDGNLAVSRGLGDFEYKGSSEKPPQDQKVSCVPDLYEVHGLVEGSLCVLCCDGVWDVLTSHEVAVLVRDQFEANPKPDLGDIASMIIRLSLQRNSRDNITAMVVHMAPGIEWAESKPFDEMQGYEKMLPDSEEKVTDEEVKNMYIKFLRRTDFPPEVVKCEECNKWFLSMMRCPCGAVNYCCKQCQKKGWKKHKPKCAAANPATPGSAASGKKK